MAEVRVQEGEPLENALRRFKRKVQTEDIIKEVKRHSFYLKPGEKKRVKEALARKRNRKKVRKEQDSSSFAMVGRLLLLESPKRRPPRIRQSDGLPPSTGTGREGL